MNQVKLKEAMEHINITDEMQTDILKNVRSKQRSKQSRPADSSLHESPLHSARRNSMTNWKKTVSAAAAALVAVGIISIPVQAGIRYLIRERMESLPEEEVKTISEMMEQQDMQEGDADKFSRSYTETELTRKAELFKAYQNGTFPEGELLRVTGKAQADQDILCYNETNSFFYLPEREMTDEELLQIIDFNYKRDFALEQSAEVHKLHAEQKKEQEQLQSQVAESGGIDESKAIETAKSWMHSLFSLSTDGMEENCYLEEELFEVPTYCVTFSIQSNCYYYFWVNTLDGSLMQVSQSQASWLDLDSSIVKERAEEQAQEAFAATKSFLEEKLGISEAYKEIHCFYYLSEGAVPGRSFHFYFIMEDGSAYHLSVLGANNEVNTFTQTTKESYQETLKRTENDTSHTIVTVDVADYYTAN